MLRFWHGSFRPWDRGEESWSRAGEAVPVPQQKKKGEKETENEGNVLEIGNITDSQLDPVYIQSLLDRIASLKEDGSVDKNEIRRLSDELDAIMLKLRQKNEKVNN